MISQGPYSGENKMFLRKTMIACGILLVVLLANADSIVTFLDAMGVTGLARLLRAHYMTGPAITVVFVLLILLPSKDKWPPRHFCCRVCEGRMAPRGNYCPMCGSRVIKKCRKHLRPTAPWPKVKRCQATLLATPSRLSSAAFHRVGCVIGCS